MVSNYNLYIWEKLFYHQAIRIRTYIPKIPCIKIHIVMLLSISNKLHKDAPERKESLMEQDYKKLKEYYINAIIKMLNNCDDISLIDIIKRLLEKSV